MAEKVKAMYIKEGSEAVEIMEIDDELATYYELTGCDCVDMPMRTVGGHRLAFVCDDEGLLKDRLPTAADAKGRVMLVGSLVIVGRDELDPEFRSLTDEEVKAVMDNLLVCTVKDVRSGKYVRQMVLTGVGY